MTQEKSFLPIKHKRFIPSKGSQITEGQAQLIGETISQIENEKGYVTPEFLVNVAQDPQSPLHPYFEWDDATAAKHHRIEQARKLIRSVLVQERPATEEESRHVQPRAFLNVSYEVSKNRYQRVYLSTEHVLNDPELSSQVTSKFLSDLRSFQTRFEKWRELLAESGYSEIFAAIDKAVSMEGDGARDN